mgnify:CR=1 FL=1
MAGVDHFAHHIEYNKDLQLNTGSRILRRSPQIMEHFEAGAGAMNSWVPQIFVTTETGAATPFAVGATGATVATGVTGTTTDNGQELAGKLVGWNPSTMDDADLIMEVRMKTTSTTARNGDFFLGFSDAVTETNSLPYVISLTSGLTTHAPSEFAGFCYSSIPTSGALFSSTNNTFIGAITTKVDVDTVTASTKIKDSNYHVYRVRLTAAGHAQFFYDDEKIMTVASAVTANTALTPYISIVAKASEAQTMLIDYIYVGGSYV